MAKEEFDQITTEVCGLPKFFLNVLFERIDSGKSGKINKQHFIHFWKKDFEKLDIKKRMFKLIAKAGVEHIISEDFKPLFKQLLETHPGLEFLQQTPEF